MNPISEYNISNQKKGWQIPSFNVLYTSNTFYGEYGGTDDNEAGDINS